MFSTLLQTARGISNRSVLVNFLTNLIVYSIKKIYKSYWCSTRIACLEKRTYWILRILTFNDKNSLYLPIVLNLFFEGQSDQGVTKLVISQTLITVSLN